MSRSPASRSHPDLKRGSIAHITNEEGSPRKRRRTLETRVDMDSLFDSDDEDYYHDIDLDAIEAEASRDEDEGTAEEILPIDPMLAEFMARGFDSSPDPNSEDDRDDELSLPTNSMPGAFCDPPGLCTIPEEKEPDSPERQDSDKIAKSTIVTSREVLADDQDAYPWRNRSGHNYIIQPTPIRIPMPSSPSSDSTDEDYAIISLPRYQNRLQPTEQMLLGPGRNWKDSFFYNLFCAFKTQVQIDAREFELGGNVMVERKGRVRGRAVSQSDSSVEIEAEYVRSRWYRGGSEDGEVIEDRDGDISMSG